MSLQPAWLRGTVEDELSSSAKGYPHPIGVGGGAGMKSEASLPAGVQRDSAGRFAGSSCPPQLQD